ncbi:MAG: sensor histidine kinase [Acholeplasmatales bacterium]|nr:MAG: sensor histidine kinase [Acholeplasmatales bacterium]
MMRKIRGLYNKLSLSTQIIMTIILVFISFFVLQTFLNAVFFRNYYVNREIDAFNIHFQAHVTALSAVNDEDYYDAMYAFTGAHNVYSIILEPNFTPVLSLVDAYRVQFHHPDEDVMTHVVVFDNHHAYVEGETVDIRVMPYVDSSYTICALRQYDVVLYEQSCQEPSPWMTVTVETVLKPTTMNSVFERNPLGQRELRRLVNQEVDLTQVQNGSGYRYIIDDASPHIMVFIEPIDDDRYVMAVKQLQSTDAIINVVSAYQSYVYLTAVAIIILWSFRIGTVASTPIKNIEKTSRQIANLNFDVVAKDSANKEAASLSESINLISRNLRTTIETINKKNSELVALYKAQTQQSNLRRQLVSSISHELKTPLMIIQVTLQAIIDGIISSDDIPEELQNALDEVNTSSVMLQDLLQIYKVDNRDALLADETVNLGELVQAAFEDLEMLFQSNALNTEIDIDVSLLIAADGTLIERVVSNFMTNAVKYTPSGEFIRIRVYRKDTVAVFEIENKGVRIPEVDLEKIWLPFYRLEAPFEARIKNRSSGIGLYLVAEILNAHRFTYAIRNTQNGVKASFEAPLKDFSTHI